MASKNELLQRAWHKYEAANGHPATSLHEVSRWGVAAGLLTLPDVDPYEILASEMAKALREEYKVDAKGRRYRVNHAVRITKAGVQLTFWAELGHAPRSHME